MTDEELNETRLEHGTQVVEAFAALKGKPDAGAKLLEAFKGIARGVTDTGDAHTMIIDLMGDVAHHAHGEGVSFSEIVEGVENGSDSDYSEIFRLMKRELADLGENYDAVINMVEIHLNSEMDLSARP